jgi:hypothetical protein
MAGEMMKLFRKPSWLKPEINELLYYAHLLILSVTVLGLLQLFFGGDMFTLKNVLVSLPILLVGDVVAHTIFQLK